MIDLTSPPYCDKPKPCEVCGHWHIDTEEHLGYLRVFCWQCGAATNLWSNPMQHCYSDTLRGAVNDWNNDEVYAWDEESLCYNDETLKTQNPKNTMTLSNRQEYEQLLRHKLGLGDSNDELAWKTIACTAMGDFILLRQRFERLLSEELPEYKAMLAKESLKVDSLLNLLENVYGASKTQIYYAINNPERYIEKRPRSEA